MLTLTDHLERNQLNRILQPRPQTGRSSVACRMRQEPLPALARGGTVRRPCSRPVSTSKDRWDVLARRDLEQERIRTPAGYGRARQDGRFALVLSFAGPASPSTPRRRVPRLPHSSTRTGLSGGSATRCLPGGPSGRAFRAGPLRRLAEMSSADRSVAVPGADVAVRRSRPRILCPFGPGERTS
jgi:hypothetical protein